MGKTQRINVTFPEHLLDELDKLVPLRKRSQIIVMATAEYVRKLELLSAIKETAGVWGEDSHPELAGSAINHKGRTNAPSFGTGTRTTILGHSSICGLAILSFFSRTVSRSLCR